MKLYLAEVIRWCARNAHHGHRSSKAEQYRRLLVSHSPCVRAAGRSDSSLQYIFHTTEGRSYSLPAVKCFGQNWNNPGLLDLFLSLVCTHYIGHTRYKWKCSNFLFLLLLEGPSSPIWAWFSNVSAILCTSPFKCLSTCREKANCAYDTKIPFKIYSLTTTKQVWSL